MTPWFLDASGQECDFEDSTLMQELSDAIKSLPGADKYGDWTFEEEAFSLNCAKWDAMRAGIQNRTNASYRHSEEDLRKLDKLAGDLIRHIDKMRRPAIEGLERENASLPDLSRALADVREAARMTFYDLDPTATNAGRPKKQVAANVTIRAAAIFREIVGRESGVTNCPETSAVSGDWHDFLGRVFSVLEIKASVASQNKINKGKKAQKIVD